MDELQTKLARLEYELNQINPKGGRAKEGRLIEDKLKEEKSIQKSPSGQLAFYHIWATSCGPCLGELARVVELAKKLRQQGVSVSFIAEEATSSMNTASTLFAKYGGTADLLKIQQGIAGDFRHRNKLPPATQPVSLLTGPGGRRLFVRVGALKSSDYELLTRCAAQRPEHVCQ